MKPPIFWSINVFITKYSPLEVSLGPEYRRVLGGGVAITNMLLSLSDIFYVADRRGDSKSGDLLRAPMP